MSQNCAHQLYCVICHLEFLSWTKVRLHGALTFPREKPELQLVRLTPNRR